MTKQSGGGIIKLQSSLIKFIHDTVTLSRFSSSLFFLHPAQRFVMKLKHSDDDGLGRRKKKDISMEIAKLAFRIVYNLTLLKLIASSFSCDCACGVNVEVIYKPFPLL